METLIICTIIIVTVYGIVYHATCEEYNELMERNARRNDE